MTSYDTHILGFLLSRILLREIDMDGYKEKIPASIVGKTLKEEGFVQERDNCWIYKDEREREEFCQITAFVDKVIVEIDIQPIENRALIIEVYPILRGIEFSSLSLCKKNRKKIEGIENKILAKAVVQKKFALLPNKITMEVPIRFSKKHEGSL